ncbi:MAG: thioesterase domain-containing protein [Terriglobales bacterium]
MPVSAHRVRLPAAPPPAPADVGDRLAAIWREVLGLESVGLNENYFDLGGDSALAVVLFARIEREFGRKLPLATLFDAATIAELAAVLQRQPRDASPLVSLQAAGAKRPLFLVHDATGTVLGYRHLARRLGAERPIYGLQAAESTTGAAHAATVEGLARRYLQALRAVQSAGPYYLAGYCGGGTIAYEMAQQLTQSGEPVGLLALIDTFNWDRLPPRSGLDLWWFDAERLGFFVRNACRLRGVARRRLFADKISALGARVLRIPTHGLRQAWNADTAALGAALQRYEAKPYPGRVLDVRPGWQHRRLRGERAKWGGLALGGQQVLLLPVHAGGVLPEPLVQHLAETLGSALHQADAATAGAPQ